MAADASRYCNSTEYTLSTESLNTFTKSKDMEMLRRENVRSMTLKPSRRLTYSQSAWEVAMIYGFG
jgi:hypothetical protein